MKARYCKPCPIWYTFTMAQIKAVFFDYDGVMTYDKTGIESICKYISNYMDIDKNIFENEYKKFVGDLLYGKTSHEKIWDQLCTDLGINIPIAFLFHSFNQTPIDKDMHELVLKIKEKGFKTGMISGNFADRMKYIKYKFDLQKYFDTFAVTGELGFGKDSEKIFQWALNELEVEPDESIFIDNQDKNLLIPRKLGMHVIYFDDEKRDWHRLLSNMEKHGIVID